MTRFLKFNDINFLSKQSEKIIPKSGILHMPLKVVDTFLGTFQ